MDVVIVLDDADVNVMIKTVRDLFVFVDTQVIVMAGVKNLVIRTVNLRSVIITDYVRKNAHKCFLIVIMVCVWIVP